MFLSILNNTTGEEYIRRVSPSENTSIEDMVKKWLDNTYEGDVKLAESSGYIPCGCGEYFAEIRRTKSATGSCLESFDFYTEYVGA